MKPRGRLVVATAALLAGAACPGAPTGTAPGPGPDAAARPSVARAAVPPTVPIAPAPAPAEPEADPPVRFEPLGPRPPGYVAFPDEDGGGSGDRRCGPYRIAQQDDRVRLLRADGSVALDARPGRDESVTASYEVAWCCDVDGDGTSELLLRHETGGTQCCHEEKVLSLGPTIRTVVSFSDGGNGGSLEPYALGGSAPFEIVGFVDSAGQRVTTCAPHGARPFFPVVFALRGGRFRRATRDYPELLRTVRRNDLVALAADDFSSYCHYGGEMLELSLALGDWETFKRTIPADRDGLFDLDDLEDLRPSTARWLARQR